jgi:hypothetical protein
MVSEMIWIPSLRSIRSGGTDYPITIRLPVWLFPHSIAENSRIAFIAAVFNRCRNDLSDQCMRQAWMTSDDLFPAFLKSLPFRIWSIKAAMHAAFAKDSRKGRCVT